jgi:hypothetical protein
MTRGEQRAIYEQNLSRARRALAQAASAAESVGDEGAQFDLEQMTAHLLVMMQGSLSSKGRKPMRGQQSLLSAPIPRA